MTFGRRNAITGAIESDPLAKRFAHIVYAEPSTSGMVDILSLAIDRKAGFAYVTDDDAIPCSGRGMVMKCSAFIATSADGYIATSDDCVEWLDTAGKTDVDMGEDADMGFDAFIASVDCMIMGRKTMEKLSSFNLTPEQWPYRDIPVIALSRTCKQAPDNLREKVEMFSGEITELIAKLKSEGFLHAYIDGGSIITSFLNQKLLHEMIITYAPILLGEGKPLFGKTDGSIRLEKTRATVFPNDFLQIRYEVNYK